MTTGNGHSAKPLRVLHVNDCAFYAARVLAEAQSRGLPWDYYPRAVARPATGLLGRLQYVADGTRWLTGLARRSISRDLLHIHSGAMLQHTQFIPKKFVLTLHGTDIRTLQYDPRWRASILKGVKKAAAVMYTTPDLAAHVLPHRPDALYMPVPITIDKLPSPARSRIPRIVFVSRWDDSKGAELQLETARELVHLSQGRYEVVGLDWGPSAAEAARIGVRLVPKMNHEGFLEFLSYAHAAVGQSSGLLGSSELEALGIGVPLYMPVVQGLYPRDVPVGWRKRPDPRAMAALIDADLVNKRPLEALAVAGPHFIRRNHSTAAIVDRLTEIYIRALI